MRQHALLVLKELNSALSRTLKYNITTSAVLRHQSLLVDVLKTYDRTGSIPNTRKYLRLSSVEVVRAALKEIIGYMRTQEAKDAATYLYLDGRSKEIFAHRLRHNLLHGWPETVPYRWDEAYVKPQRISPQTKRRLRQFRRVLTEEDKRYILEHRLPVEMFENRVKEAKRWNRVQLAAYVNKKLSTNLAKKTVSRYCRAFISEFRYREQLRSEQIALLHLEQLRAKLRGW